MGALIVTLGVVVVEGYFVYQWYDRYHADDVSAGSVPLVEEAKGHSENASGDNVGSEAPENVASEPVGDAERTDPEEPDGVVSFVHRATDGNSRGDYTYLDHPDINGDPNAVVLVVQAPGRGTAVDSAYDHNIGVWYEPGARKWAVFNQDRAAVPPGTAFRVEVPRGSEGFVERLASGSSDTNGTYLDHTLLNGEPDAVLTVTQNWNPGGGVGVYNDHPIGVDYDEQRDRWLVYNTNLAPMKEGVAFNIGVS